MPFYIYKRTIEHGREILSKTGEHFHLAGYGLIYNAWIKRNKPVNIGWHVNIEELVNDQSKGCDSYESLRLVIDYNPKTLSGLALIEILDVYVYTFGGSSKDKVGWSPIMIRGRDVLYEDCEKDMTLQEKEKRQSRIENPPYSQGDFVEFLYLQGSDGSWNWGPSGRTNAVFLYGGAREYFRKHF